MNFFFTQLWVGIMTYNNNNDIFKCILYKIMVFDNLLKMNKHWCILKQKKMLSFGRKYLF
jgi:hypothetical protein